ncbi:putative Heterochromatin-associated protein MENT [Hypsibius exemplaris]|uniref:Heterochromatin-associated protein MENT n=1 Tax=Hypsibius exemplaris TaxID=2072580 RepID=A0A1W0WFZ1_HYPEX|nr:putative Heterochromatin-associated protein MENT [Hypsibius exemplaris]
MEYLRKPLTMMTMRLFHAAKESYPEDNVIICPFTVTSVVTMLYYAAEDSPAGRQMEHILKFADLMDGRADKRAVLMAFRDATRTLTKISSKAVESDSHSLAREFHMAVNNRVFIKRNTLLNPDFLETIKKNLKIEFEHINFDEEADADLSKLEKWLKEKLKANFNEILTDDLVDHSYTGPRMVIASEAHFRAGWEIPFDRKQTVLSPFFTIHGKYRDVETMNMTGKFAFYEDTKLKLIELPYFRNEVSLVLTLPVKRGGLDEMMIGLSKDQYANMHSKKRMKMVKLSLPKLRFHTTYLLKNLLTQVGFKEIFNEEAVLSQMTSESVFRVSEGIHKCAFQVDEDGTFATDGTSAGTDQNTGKNTTAVSTPPPSLCGPDKSSNPPGTTDFNANHPFLLAVRHNPQLQLDFQAEKINRPTDMEHLRKPMATMAMKLFQAAKDTYPEDNIMICPFTVTSIVTMLYYAAEGTIAGKQIENILKFAELMDGRADLRAVLMAFRDATKTLTKNADKVLEDGQTSVAREFHMVLGNRVFVQRDSHLSPEFLDTIQKNLKIEFENINFDDAAEADLTKLERWLKEKIKSKFGEILTDDLVDKNYNGPRMVIASAAHFRAAWEIPFDRTLTTKSPFYTTAGKYRDVEMMHLTGKFPFYEESGVKMIEMPYFRNEVSLILTLPVKHCGLEDMTKSMKTDLFVGMHMQKRMKMIKVSLPKFRFHSTYNIKALLTQVGIKEVFNKEAVLNHMTTDSVFRVSEGIHKCAMQLDEDGTFATDKTTAGTNQNEGKDTTALKTPAASGLSSDRKSSAASSGSDEFNANHPFLMAVRHNRTGVLLFSGRINMP